MIALRTIVLLGLLAAVLASAIAVVWARQQNRPLFMQLSKLQNQRDHLNVEFGRLELEQATWADPVRIEAVARGKLDMVQPAPEDIRLVRP
jgi:cell division protein FtsL